MNGLIIPDTPIAVDFWMIRHASTAKLFFLSHAHADHTAGLSPSWNQPIYCSETTGRIIRHKFQIKKELIRTLEVNESHIVPLDVLNKETMTVSVIEANHCPGAVMFLFEGYFGTILYTGDFRYHPDMFVDSVLAQHRTIDALYLDNTYCDPGCDFPTQEVAIKEAVDLIKRHSDHKVVIGTTDIGKEELLISIARKLETLIRVPDEKYDLYSILELPNVFTTDPSEDDISVLLRKHLKIPTLREWGSNKEMPTIVLIPTCLFIGLGLCPYDNIENVFVIPFSDHSSYKELCTFVSKVKPKQIVPIVEYKKKVFGVDCTSRSDMRCFDKYLDTKERTKFTVPNSVQFLMSSANTFNLKRPYKTKQLRSRSTSAKRLSKPKHSRRGVVYNTPTKSLEKNVSDNESETAAPVTEDDDDFILPDLGQTLDDQQSAMTESPERMETNSQAVSPLFGSTAENLTSQQNELFCDLTDMTGSGMQSSDENSGNRFSRKGRRQRLHQNGTDVSRGVTFKFSDVANLCEASNATEDDATDKAVLNNIRPRGRVMRGLCRILKLTIPVKKQGPLSYHNRKKKM